METPARPPRVVSNSRNAWSAAPFAMPDGRTIEFWKRQTDGTGNERWEVSSDGGLPTPAPANAGLRRLRDGSMLVGEAHDLVIQRGTQGLALAQADRGTTLGTARPQLVQLLIGGFDVSPDHQWIAHTSRDSVVLRTLRMGTRHVLGAGVSPRFIADDVLAFRGSDGTLQVGRLAPDRSRFTALPVPMVPNVLRSESGEGVFTIGDDGTPAYVPGTSAGQSRLVWVAAGREQPVPNAEVRSHAGVALSRDGRRAAVSVGSFTQGGDIWIADLELGSMSPLTNDRRKSRATWRSDGQSVTFLEFAIISAQAADGLGGGARGRGASQVWQRKVDSAAPTDSVPGPWPVVVDEVAWSPDERYVAMRTRRRNRAGNRDIIVRQFGRDSLIPFAAEDAQERGPRFSPDGRWLLYVSDRTARDEVYAESFPGGGNRVRLSADGGREGVWSRDGSRVFYRVLDGWMIAAHVSRGATVQVTRRERLFDAKPYIANQFLVTYDVTPDNRLLMMRAEEQPPRTEVVIIRNWVQQVRARLAGSR